MSLPPRLKRWAPIVAGLMWLLALGYSLQVAGRIRHLSRQAEARALDSRRLRPQMERLARHTAAEAEWAKGSDAIGVLTRVLSGALPHSPPQRNVSAAAPLSSGGSAVSAELAWDAINMADLMRFAQALESQPLPWRVITLRCVAGATAGRVRAELTAETFRP